MATSKKCATCNRKTPTSRHKYCTSCKNKKLPLWKQAILAKESGIVQVEKTTSVVGKTKYCSRCKQYKPFADFNGKKSKLSAYCSICTNEYAAERRLLLKFGMTLEQYEKLYEKQEGKCAICQKYPRKMRLAVDHDHKTGAVRGLLCKRCNHDLLGSAHDSVEILEAAIDYLTNPPAGEEGIYVP